MGGWKALPKEGLKRQQVTSQTANVYFFRFHTFSTSAPPIPSLVGGWRALSLFVATLDFCAVQAICGGGAIMAKRYPGDLH